MTEEISKMVEVFNRYDESLRNNKSFKHYLAPDFPDIVVDKLFDTFDSFIPAFELVAFYDENSLGNCSSGLLFTCDGLYFKEKRKTYYVKYNDISTLYYSGSKELILGTISQEETEYKIHTKFNKEVLIDILKELYIIDKKYGQFTQTETGEVKKQSIPSDMIKKCNVIIHTASVACGGVGTGLAQIPCADSAVITPVQIFMIQELGRVFDLSLSEAMAKGLITSYGAAQTGRTASQLLVGWIPVAGNIINTVTAAGLTEAIGWLAVKDFSTRWREDKTKGRYDGMKEGYAKASAEYEQKLREQADLFLRQIKDAHNQKDEYEQLLQDYEDYIAQLERENASFKKIIEAKSDYNNLRNLKSA